MIAADTLTVEAFERLLADESVPVVHRALWLLLWISDKKVLDLLALQVADADAVRPPPGSPYAERADALLTALAADRASGPLFANGPRTLTWDEAVRTAASKGVALHTFRTSGKHHR
ncbi:hypothetical protein RM780_12615 [Streptomyces sp. DSM 44917]|uniref:Uncharacterized protein n=1 Tax=Streptomyces boetiae TaxID=3075541 RepID=A0ABU2L8A5_9ACTN|nr:hypothetical protein [Streptomyces sp. DSM 44917]MDT0307799.1 hypothetical protein [Streptomyces sp. DSM 44917]